MDPIRRRRLEGKTLPVMPFDLSKITFTPGASKRTTSVFSTSPIVQGKRASALGAVGDVVTFPLGTAILSGFYPNWDNNQTSVAFRITPEWVGSDGLQYFLIDDTGDVFSITKSATNFLTAFGVTVDISGWVVGTTYNVLIRHDSKNPIDGTNYACISINDVHTFGKTSPTLPTMSTPIYFGSDRSGARNINAIVEGFTVFRRVLYDGTYGVDVGNGDEVALISAGIDPTSLGGSWDVPFCFPTNQTAGALATGTGEAWSHPWTSNVVTDPWLSSYYGNPWGVKFNGTTSDINCGSDASLDNLADNALTVELLIKFPSVISSQIIIQKSTAGNSGWDFLFDVSGHMMARVFCATTNGQASTSNVVQSDGKFHHVAFTWDDAGDRKVRLFLDGLLVNTGSAAVGAINPDAASSLLFGRTTGGATRFSGTLGWCRISNSIRYSADFVPPLLMPAADANTVEQWACNEGTGATLTASVNVANNGTITNGTWEPQWQPEGTPIIPTSLIGNATCRVDVGSGATIDDLHDGAFTVDGWVRIPKLSVYGHICIKTGGWNFTINGDGTLSLRVKCATTDGYTATVGRIDDGRWHYIKATYDDAGDRKPYLYVDDTAVPQTKVAGIGAIVSDAGNNGYLGHSGGSAMVGSYGWFRWSNVVRGAGMISRIAPPAIDANTMAQWNMTEGAGTAVADSSGNANNGTVSGTYTWNTKPEMATDNPGGRCFGWGLGFGSDAASDGIKQTLTGLTAGADYVLRAIGFSGTSGLGQPKIIVYDETNGAEITSITGTTTSTYNHPDVFIISWELPTAARGAASDCTSMSIKLVNVAGAGVVYWDQCEVLPNLIDNPSMHTGAVADPWIPYGWTNAAGANALVAGEASLDIADYHSSGGSWVTAGGNVHWMTSNSFGASGKYYCLGGWMKAVAGTEKIWQSNGTMNKQAGGTWVYSNAVASWVHKSGVGRPTGANALVPGFGGGDGKFDDLYVFLLTDVSLTVTPASQANSLEGTGIRVDGADVCTQPAAPINQYKGSVRFKWTPRHSAADFVKFIGMGLPYLCSIYYNNNNRIALFLAAANQITLRVVIGGVTVNATWTCTGLITAGTTYNIEIRWKGGNHWFILDGATILTVANANIWAGTPSIVYFGCSPSGATLDIDGVISPP